MIAYTELKNLALKSKSDRFWYSKARQSIKSLAARENIPFKTLAGVVAITSQNIRLSHNEQIVLDWIQNGANVEAAHKVKHFGVVKRNLAEFLQNGSVKGPKISAFYKALTGDTSAIVLDTHMAKVFLPKAKSEKWTKTQILKAESKILRLSKELGWKPCHVQAAIWCSIYKEASNSPYAVNYSF
jgi:hypothetical protein